MTDRGELSGTDTRSLDADLPLIRAIADGDEEALATFVRRHERRIRGVCRGMLGDREESRDAAQEVFLKVWKKAHRFRPRGKVSTWLYRVTVNHCLNRLRRRKIVTMLPFPGQDDEGEATWEPKDRSPGVDRALESRERWRRTCRALDGLPDTQRAVVVLVRFEGLSYRETAEALGITLGAVESRLFRAMRNLEKACGTSAETETR
ncbi:MAG: sigma-70 family RNA polymerase sigma factor [Thermoanaerobaculia bacterium]|nr:sigma-70 family RNA polymerase sigma factor [Thermoanaerobaculia bacterium]